MTFNRADASTALTALLHRGFNDEEFASPRLYVVP
jgi:hypothetical protein